MPEPLAIPFFFVLALGVVEVFFWLAVPPALDQLEQALARRNVGAATVDHSTGIGHDVLVWVEKQLRDLPSGSGHDKTFLEIDRRLGSYTRLKLLMVVAVGVSVVGVLFGALAVALAIPVTSAVATLIDVLVLDHEAPTPFTSAGGAQPSTPRARPS